MAAISASGSFFPFPLTNPAHRTSTNHSSPSPSALPQRQPRRLRKVTLPLEPVFHRRPQFFERDLAADLHHPIRQRQRVVELAGIGEVAHGKTVEPLQLAWPGLSLVFKFHMNPASEHAFDLNTLRRPPRLEQQPYDRRADF